MLNADNSSQCRVCKDHFMYHDLKDGKPGKPGICFQCLLIEFRKLKLLLRIKNHGKKKNRLRKS